MSAEQTTKTAHQFSFNAIDGRALPLSRYNGKAVLIVNTASRCGFTPQYEDLQYLWQRYQDRGLVVLGSRPTISAARSRDGGRNKNLLRGKFRRKFSTNGKVYCQSSRAHPFYQWAGDSFGAMAKPRWNFHKYLITPDGHLADWFSSITSPRSERLIRAVEAVLPK